MAKRMLCLTTRRAKGGRPNLTLIPFDLQMVVPALLVLMIGASACAQQVYGTHSLLKTTAAVPQGRISSASLRYPMVRGSGIRFSRPDPSSSLSRTYVANMLQGVQDFLWFGTLYGLNRFDGYNTRAFVRDPQRPESLGGVSISALFKDRNGVIWVGCDQFLNRFNESSETFTQYPIPSVRNISQDRSGMLWLATPDGLFKFDPSSGRRLRYFHDQNDPESLSSNDVKSAAEDKLGDLWVATLDGLDKLDRNTGKVRFHVPFHDSASGFSFFEDRFGVFWVFSSTKPLAILDRKTGTLSRISSGERNAHREAPIFAESILEDRDGTLWLGTIGTGLLRFDREHDSFVSYQNQANDPNSIPRNNVRALLQDQEGSIWMALGDTGICRFATGSQAFQQFDRAVSLGAHPADPLVGAIYQDHDRGLWIGTRDALNFVNRKMREYGPFLRRGSDAPKDVITMREDASNHLWIGTYGHGLFRLDRETGQFKKFQHDPHSPNSLSSDIVTRLILDRNGTLWAATWDGLDRFDFETQQFKTYKVDSRIGNAFFMDIVEGPDSALWLATQSSGLLRFDPRSEKFMSYQHDLNEPGSLSDDRVNSLLFDTSGTMWIGTQSGLDEMHLNTGRFTSYTQRNGLPGNAVDCILEDNRERLWMSTNDGIASFDLHTRAIRNYSIADGLPGNDLFGWGSCIKASSGEMFFGGFSGLTSFFPDSLREDTAVPVIALTDFRLSGFSVVPGADSVLKKSINYAKVVTLTHAQNVFSIEFSALSFVSPATNRYRYMLEPLDPTWNEVKSDQRVASYTTLPTGRYTFRVQGATARGAWSEPGASVLIEILPPWWATLRFRVASATLLLMLGFVAYRFRLREISTAISSRFDERLEERTRLAREFHDTLLQTIIGSKFVMDHALDQAGDTNGMHQALTKVSAYMERAIREGREDLSSLRSSSGDGGDLQTDLQQAIEEYLIYESIQVLFTVVGEGQDVHPIVRYEAFRICQEALRNACVHSRGTHVEVELRYGRSLTLSVKDNGVGIESNVISSGKTGHFGLQGMRERAARIESKLSIKSSAASGTEVRLVVPGGSIFRATTRGLASPPSRIRTPFVRRDSPP